MRRNQFTLTFLDPFLSPPDFFDLPFDILLLLLLLWFVDLPLLLLLPLLDEFLFLDFDLSFLVCFERDLDLDPFDLLFDLEFLLLETIADFFSFPFPFEVDLLDLEDDLFCLEDDLFKTELRTLLLLLGLFNSFPSTFELLLRELLGRPLLLLFLTDFEREVWLFFF